MLTSVFYQYSLEYYAVKALLTCLWGVLAWCTELHSTYSGWLVRKTGVFACSSHGLRPPNLN